MSTKDNLRRAPQLELFHSSSLETRGQLHPRRNSGLTLVRPARLLDGAPPIADHVRARFPLAPRSVWEEVPDAEWNSWQWQLRHRVTTLAQLEKVVRVSGDEREAIARTQCDFSMAITPYYAALMDPEDPRCPVRLQSVPTTGELLIQPSDLEDPLGEEKDMPVPGLTHRYPDRVLFYISHNCPVYCRHCTRKRKVAKPTSAAARKQIDDGIAYIARHPEVRDVVVSGGDPLSLSDDRLDEILGRLRVIQHVEIIRLGTRNLVTLPQRITDDFVRMLRRHQPVFVNTHFNHPKECTAEAFEAARKLADAGITLGNQMVLLKGINDDPRIVKELNQKLLMMRVKPYYIYQCDLAKGISHFRTSVDKGIEIIDALRGWTSGLAVPHFVIDAPCGGGKIPVLPQYVTGREGKKLLLRNYRHQPYCYEEP
ncbi:MAG: KamA family radical SAM protein [Deltaproteobacteria bacterium]|nr:KamA family radical SAM protein [Deltaproteobacteria bacterium]